MVCWPADRRCCTFPSIRDAFNVQNGGETRGIWHGRQEITSDVVTCDHPTGREQSKRAEQGNSTKGHRCREPGAVNVQWTNGRALSMSWVTLISELSVLILIGSYIVYRSSQQNKPLPPRWRASRHKSHTAPLLPSAPPLAAAQTCLPWRSVLIEAQPPPGREIGHYHQLWAAQIPSSRPADPKTPSGAVRRRAVC
ncbi:hypothetical protein GGR56DRAFT_151865 [Xylariaceae sp. FL0804]|nr:hypothetical protein GGR56DRAFT_151865 [Xylariaceae sp. FL0804]